MGKPTSHFALLLILGLGALGVLSALPSCLKSPVSPGQAMSASQPASIAQRALSESGALSVLYFSDVHFDPLADPSLVPALAQAPATQWEGIFLSGGEPEKLNGYDVDSNHALFRSFLDGAKKALPHPDLIIIPGDFLAHKLEARFLKLMSNDSHADYVVFFDKAQQYMAEQIHTAFPDAQVIPVLGNNDSPCGDYMATPGDPFYSAFVSDWAPAVNLRGDAPEFASEFPATGNYSIVVHLPRASAPLQIVGLNTTYMSRNYVNQCGSKLATPDTDELAWLEKTLQSAQGPIWIVGHIPIGIDLVATASAGVQLCSGKPYMMMFQDSDATQFLGTIDQNRSKIRAMLFGHTHMNDFRVLDAPNAMSADHQVVQIVGGAVSPIYENNPAFQILSVDPQQFTILDQSTYVLDLASALKGGSTEWTEHWDLDRDFQLKDESGQSMLSLAQKLTPSSTASPLPMDTSFESRFMAGSSLPALGMTDLKAYACSTTNMTAADFSKCYCPTPTNDR